MRTRPEPLPALLSVGEVAAACRVSEATVYRWIAAGRLPRVRFGTGTLRVRSDDLRRLLDSGGVKS